MAISPCITHVNVSIEVTNHMAPIRRRMNSTLGPMLRVEPVGEVHDSGTDDEGYAPWQQVVRWWWLN